MSEPNKVTPYVATVKDGPAYWQVGIRRAPDFYGHGRRTGAATDWSTTGKVEAIVTTVTGAQNGTQGDGELARATLVVADGLVGLVRMSQRCFMGRLIRRGRHWSDSTETMRSWEVC